MFGAYSTLFRARNASDGCWCAVRTHTVFEGNNPSLTLGARIGHASALVRRLWQDSAPHPKATSTGLAVCVIALLSPDEDLPPFADGAHKVAARTVELSGGSEPLPLRSLALAFDATGNRKRAIDLMRATLAVASKDSVEQQKIADLLQKWI